MAALEVVLMNVCRNRLSGFSDVVPFRQVGFIIFESAEPPLDHDVVGPAAFAIHALADSVLTKEVPVFAAGELASLIGVEDIRFCHPERFPAGADARSGIQRIVKLPSDDAAADPVDDGCQIQKVLALSGYR